MSTDPLPELRPDLLDDFYAECDEHFGSMRTQLALLEATHGRPLADAAPLESISRSLHSFKGIAAMAGLRDAEQLAHAAEDFLRPLLRQPADWSSARLDVLLAATQRMEQIVSAHRLHRPLPEGGDVMRELDARHAAPAPALPAVAASSDSATAQALHARGLAPWKCTFVPTRELDQRGVNINAVRARLGALGEIARATPSVRNDNSLAFEFLVGFRTPPSDLAGWQADGVMLQAIEVATAPAPAKAGPSAEASPSLFIAPSHIVRVDLGRLDELMRLAGEMVIHRSRLEDRIDQLGGDVSGLREVSLGLARSLRQLRAAITRVRLVPMAEIFTRMPFVVRDLARETGKRVQLVLEGEQTEIDKYLVERLKEPLLHLVRNAFSHGVESPDERLAAGKPQQATIALRARPVGEFVVIEVRDDGRGIDPARIRARAEALGVPVPAELDAAGVLAVLCHSGFTTREVADRAAGRGLGMSVVRDTVRELGGTLALETVPGRSTQFTLRLPLTLSIAETIIVSAGPHTCAVPQGYIDEIVQCPQTEVRTIRQAEVIPYRDGVLPLVRLRTIFGAGTSPQPLLPVLVLSSERGSTGLVVDRVHTQREIVVRPMRDPLLQVPGIAGATELGDGRPVLILDPVAITSRVVRPLTGTAPAALN